MKTFKQYLTESINDKGIFKAVFMGGSPGSGKAQPLTEPVLTPTGWKQMGELHPGDHVVTPSGEYAEILQTFFHPSKQTYKIQLADGGFTYACEDHLWEVYVPLKYKLSQEQVSTNKKRGYKRKIRRVVDTKTLIQLLDKYPATKEDNPKMAIRVINQPVMFGNDEDKDLPLPPYFLGCMLGDGGFTTSTISFTTNDNSIIDNIQKMFNEGQVDFIFREGYSKHDYTVKLYEDGKNILANKFREMQLFGCKSHEKFIPKQYMQSSVQQRLELLRGLMDTDGTVNSPSDLTLSSTSYQLCTHVVELARSLGMKASLHSRKASKLTKQDAYDVRINDCKNYGIFSLQRKLDKYINHSRTIQSQYRLIESIEPAGIADAQCILIDHPEHLYITRDYITTHNTYVMNKLKAGQIEPRVVNTDRALEYFAKRDNIDLSKEYDYAYVDKSKKTTQQMLVQYINGMLPLFIDGTSANPNNLLRRIGMLESYGYDVAMVWVDTDVETAVQRIQQRSRQVPEETVRQVHRTAEENRQYYQGKFDTFVEIDNNDGMLDEQTIQKAFNKVTGFYNSEIQNPIGQRVVQQAREQGYKYLAPHFHELNEIQQNVAVWYRKG